MDNPEENTHKTANIECENSQELSLSLENNNQFEENAFLTNNIADPLKVVTQSSNSENIISSKTSDINSQNENIASKTNSTVPTDNSMSPQPLPPLPKDDKGAQPTVPNTADYNMQNYSNYNYMYNYNNYYGYPYPQYQWDYNSQQYYQPYQNYYNYNYNANQAQTSSKPPPPPPDAVQLPVEEKPTGKTNVSTADDSNRYSPTVETDDDDTMKAISENKSDVPTEQLNKLSTNSNYLPTMPSEQIVIQQNMSENVDNIVGKHIIPSITPVQQPVVPVVSQIPPYNIPVQQPSYLINPQTQVKSAEFVELTNQHQNVPALNGKHDSVEKVSKGSTVLGKTQAKKRLMAFSMMKQKMQEQNNSTYDNQNSDIGEGNDVEFVPELNVFQTVTKKKVLTNKKVAKVIKAQQTIEQIEEMKKDEIMQGNNAALYQHFLRSGGNEAPILQKLGIESLAEKYSAKIREQDKRLKRHHHRRRDDNRRSHKYRRRSHSKSRSRSRSKSRSAEKPKMRALEVKSWKDFINAGFNFDKFRRFKMDETEEIKEKERKSRTKKRQGESRSDGKDQNTESALSTEIEIGVGNQKLRFNLLDRKKEILKGLEVLTQQGDYSKYYPSSITRCTKSKPTIKFSENPTRATYHLQNRHQMLATLLPEIESIVHKFLSSMKPKKLKDNPTDDNCNHIDDKLLNMMKDSNIYPFNGWWPKTYFIIYQVKEDPNVEIDKDALVNELATSKRTKRSRFNDDTSMIDLRPTVPSKWDSDYDASPVIDKVMDVEVSQNLKIITSNDSVLKQENNPPVMSSQDEESMDNKSNVSEVVPTINMISTLPSLCPETQIHAVLDTEYEKFLKIVNVEKSEKAVENNLLTTTITRDIENNLSVKSTSLNGDSIEDSSTKSSDEFASLHSAEERLINDKSFVNRLASADLKLKKKKKRSSKKSKKFKKKESKKKKRVSSSSESSQDSESDSDSSSEDSDSETTDSTSSVERKKSKSKDKKKKKGKTNFKKKHKSDKSKTKNSEDEKDNNSSILNLIEKAFNVEIKKKSFDDEDLKHKKKKRKHEKKENKSNDENEDNFEKVKECLKETITKLVKTDKMNKNKSLTSDGNPVSDVFKYFNIDAEKIKKTKKSKKSFKRKHESDDSDEENTPKKNRLDTSLKIKDGEKKKKSKKKKSSEKRLFDSEEHVSKKKSKKKPKTTDSSDTDDEELEQKKIKNDNDHFFGLRPNEWNIKKTKSSMRGVVYQSDVKNINSASPTNDTSGLDEEVNIKRYINLNKKNQNEVLELPNALVEQRENNSEKESGEHKEYNIENDKILITSDKCDDDLFKPKNDVLQNTTLSINDNIKEPFLNKDLNNVLKLTQNSGTNTIIKPIGETISYRDKVKMNLKKLSTCQHIPFVFGFTSPLSLLKPTNLKIEKLKLNLKETNQHTKSEVNKSTLLKFDRQNVNCRQTSNNKTHVTNIVPPKIDIVANDKTFDSSFSQEYTEKSIPNSRRYLSDQGLNEHIEFSVLKNKLFNKFDNRLYQNDLLSNCGVDKKIEGHSFDTTDSSSCGSDSESQNEDTLFDFDNGVAEENITTSSNSTNVSQFEPHSECSMILPQNTSSVQLTDRNSDAICIKSPDIDLEASIINNELIGQWTTDWSKLNMSVTEYNSSINQIDDPSELQLKKSRWDEPPRYDEIDIPKLFINEQIEPRDVLNYSSTDNLENKNIQPKEELISEEQICEINSIVDDTRYYSENWAYETIENDQLIPVDYSIYENYNPNYNCHDEHYNKWKSVDTSDQLTNLAITSDNLSTIQVVNVSEIPSDNVSIDEAEISKGEVKSVKDEATDEILITVTSDVQDGIVQDEKSASVLRDEQFFKLYQQHFQHYKQNPIKYSMSEPILDNITDVNINILDKLPTQEKFNIDHNDSKTVSIPSQHRAYSCIIEDNDIIIYLTSDNYIAYCAINDKCMVHIALESISRNGVENEVRHCFNVNENGSIDEYWLPADLIPFHVPSDAESGVFMDDDVDHDESDSSLEDVVDNNDYDVKEEDNGNMMEGEWEMIDSISEENVDTWLNDPCILNKYGRNNLNNVDHTVTNINQEGSVSSSSDYDTDTSDFSNSYFETSLTKKQNIVNAVMVDPMKQSENYVENLDLVVESYKSAALSINLDSNIEINNEKGVMEVKQELVTENNEDNILIKSEENENMKESGFVSVKEVTFDDISTMDTLLNQQNFIKKLNIHTKEANEYSKDIDKHTDTLMVHYSDNMETVKYPFLGLFQPPTISILSQKQSITTSSSKMRKRVTFADGIHPGDNLTASPTHNDNGRPLSPLPLKSLWREVLKFRRNRYPFKKTNVLSKFNMVNKKVATVIPSIKTTSSSVIEYYFSRQRPRDLPIINTFNNSVMKSENSPNSDNTDNDCNKFGRNYTPPRPTRELTPVPSDSESWYEQQ